MFLANLIRTLFKTPLSYPFQSLTSLDWTNYQYLCLQIIKCKRIWSRLKTDRRLRSTAPHQVFILFMWSRRKNVCLHGIFLNYEWLNSVTHCLNQIYVIFLQYLDLIFHFDESGNGTKMYLFLQIIFRYLIKTGIFLVFIFLDPGPPFKKMYCLWSPAVHPKQGPKVTIDMMVTGGLASSSYPATASNTGSWLAGSPPLLFSYWLMSPQCR